VDIYTTEEQQVAAIKKWWDENKWSLIGGVVLGVGALWGGRAWLDNQQQFSETASAVYQMMLENVAQGKNDDAATQGAQLLGQFSDTAYASLAALMMAKTKLEEGDAAAASAHLRWALDNTESEAVRHEARLRLTKIMMAEGKYDDALNFISGVEAGVYESTYEQLKGDIYVAMGQPESARTAFMRALASASPGERGHELLQMKLDNLGQPASGDLS